MTTITIDGVMQYSLVPKVPNTKHNLKEINIDGVWYLLVPQEPQELFNDWRLPTIQELATLINYEKCNPACALEDAVSDLHWSSSPHAVYSNEAWYVSFKDGSVSWGNKSYTGLVRYVRDGKDGLEWAASSPRSLLYSAALEYANN